MLEVIWRFIPIAICLIASPLAVLAMVGLMLGPNAKRNCAAFTLGWLVSIAAVFAFFLFLLDAIGFTEPHPEALRARILHGIVGVICLTGAFLYYRKAQQVTAALQAASTPSELAQALPRPRAIKDLEAFSAPRSLRVGALVFLTNPPNLALTAATAVEVLSATLTRTEATGLAIVFMLAAAAPVLAPTMAVLGGWHEKGDNAHRIFNWTLSHNSFIRAGTMLLIGFIQLGKAVTGGLF
ncbi:hypothetical protein GOARA_013_00860 [Gordonia araii NBRC 100433]|uniref:Sap-like sulfolipid-1-addressing protein n=1 Tax=Gordonia araii NBRC 100433 TaxID=1073574 RepID=G7GYG7_9ACTN|nr:GAP family protein [Gordonia araii]NNG97361.1 hypothetical protein [Gordonia araii NBRC 100433]GAB08642.1 hypothetical protein GOARA_013_00860 [Gordonia araii NBRC 100433]